MLVKGENEFKCRNKSTFVHVRIKKINYNQYNSYIISKTWGAFAV